jgi:hypothetical protein
VVGERSKGEKVEEEGEGKRDSDMDEVTGGSLCALV